MPVRVCCPHCRTPCSIAEQHLGAAVKCGRCGRAFTTTVPPLRLDVGGAAKGDGFMVRQLAWCNLDERHEAAVLAIAGDLGRDRAGDIVVRAFDAALTPLLNDLFNGANRDIMAYISAALRQANRAVWQDSACKGTGASAAVVVVRDGQVHIGHVGACRVYHHNGGRLTQLSRDGAAALGKAPQVETSVQQLKLASADWLLLLRAGLDAAALQAEIAQSSSATQLARRILERPGNDNRTVAVLRCY